MTKQSGKRCMRKRKPIIQKPWKSSRLVVVWWCVPASPRGPLVALTLVRRMKSRKRLHRRRRHKKKDAGDIVKPSPKGKAVGKRKAVKPEEKGMNLDEPMLKQA